MKTLRVVHRQDEGGLPPQAPEKVAVESGEDEPLQMHDVGTLLGRQPFERA